MFYPEQWSEGSRLYEVGARMDYTFHDDGFA
jgi:hypothetical protein